MRKRNCSLLLRVTPAEKKLIKEKADAAGVSLQSYLLQSALYSKAPTAVEIENLKTIANFLDDYDTQLRGIGTNINQVAYVANSQGDIPTAEELTRLGIIVRNIRRECDHAWQLLRSLLATKVR